MSTHNIHFCGGIRKISLVEKSVLSGAMLKAPNEPFQCGEATRPND